MLRRAFKMEVGKDYKVISFQGEPERIAALVNGDIEAALISVPHAPQGAQGRHEDPAAHRRLTSSAPAARSGHARPMSTRTRETVTKFIRAIAKGVMYYRDNKAGSLPTLQGASRRRRRQGRRHRSGTQTHNTFGAELPKDLFREIFESRRLDMIAAKQWPADKPLPDPEQFLTRDLLETTLKQMNYVPTKLDSAGELIARHRPGDPADPRFAHDEAGSRGRRWHDGRLANPRQLSPRAAAASGRAGARAPAPARS